jgi:hypothetical protein
MSDSSSRFNLVCIVLFTVSAIFGCGASGPPRVEISGLVTLNGKPLESGSIAFIPDAGVVGPMAGGEIKDGAYRIASTDGPTIGSHKVEIRAWRETGKVPVTGIAGATGGPSAGGTVANMEMYIPAEYNTKSNLQISVERGENHHDFDLESTDRKAAP